MKEKSYSIDLYYFYGFSSDLSPLSAKSCSTKYFGKYRNVIGFNAAYLILSSSFSVRCSFRPISFLDTKDLLGDFRSTVAGGQ